MITYKVYKYTNIINQKVYIGQTSQTLEQRAQKGENYKSCPNFYKAIQKYGWENFQSEVLEDNLTRQQAHDQEKYYISYYDSTNIDKGYNICLAWNELNQTSINIISDKAKLRYTDKTQNPMYGKKHSNKSKQIMRDKKLSSNNPMFKKKMSQESKDKIALSHLGNHYADNYWNALSSEDKKNITDRMISKIKKGVMCIEDNNTFDSITDAANFYNVSISSLSGNLHNRQHSCANKHFIFI